ncbi:MAG: hypothetical protein Q8K71_15615 [Polaromonas sp.]|nr:hypothetical protein [Hylemonella sp.]MDP1955901.1 hypothetical protein [Polaromonas sp.]
MNNPPSPAMSTSTGTASTVFPAVAPPSSKVLAENALAALKAAGHSVLDVPGIGPESTLDLHAMALDGKLFEVTSSLDRRQWAKAPTRTLTWQSVPFPPDPTTRRSLPNYSGVYAFVAEPSLFSLPQTSTLLYVGKAKQIRVRIRAYISELKIRSIKSGRPHIWRMTNAWNGHLRYYYTTTTDVAAAEALEDEMLDALNPYFNKELPAELSQRVRAFP